MGLMTWWRRGTAPPARHDGGDGSEGGGDEGRIAAQHVGMWSEDALNGHGLMAFGRGLETV